MPETPEPVYRAISCTRNTEVVLIHEIVERLERLRGYQPGLDKGTLMHRLAKVYLRWHD